LPQILRRLQANQDSLRERRGAFPHFVWTVLARCFADLVRPFSLLRFAPTHLISQLITQHSRPIPPCMFDASLPPTSPWTFSTLSLPTPRSASDCRRLDALDRSRCACPVIDAVHHRSVWCCPDELQGIGRCDFPSCTFSSCLGTSRCGTKLAIRPLCPNSCANKIRSSRFPGENVVRSHRASP
jgi:hypothetical protein